MGIKVSELRAKSEGKAESISVMTPELHINTHEENQIANLEAQRAELIDIVRDNSIDVKEEKRKNMRL